MKLKTIAIAQQKGGAGKTTLCRNLAVAAGPGAVLIDTDPQGSLTNWWNRREANSPALSAITETIAGTLAELDAQGFKLALIDTPPSKHPFVRDIIKAADFVLVPVRPTPDDLDAVGPTVDMIEEEGRNFAFVVSQAKARTRLAMEAVPSLAQHGKVAPVTIYDRVDYPTAAIDGRGVTEIGATPAAEEVRALYAYVRKQLRMGDRP